MRRRARDRAARLVPPLPARRRRDRRPTGSDRRGPSPARARRRPRTRPARGPRGGGMQMRPQRRLVGLAHERRATGQRVHEHAAERVDVGARVDALAADLLRRDEAERSDPAARAADPTRRGLALGQPEVGQVRVVLGAEQDVRRLDVAMHEPVRMCGIQRAADLRDDLRRARRLERALGAHERPQVRPVDVAHDDEQHALALARVIDRDHVRVLDRRRRLGLRDEARAEVGLLGERRGDDLQRDDAVEVEVPRAVHDAHPAASGEPLDAMVDEDVAWLELRHARRHATRSGGGGRWIAVPVCT